MGRRDETLRFLNQTAQLGRAYKRLACKDTPGQKPKDDQYQ